jgi:menaquinone-dependent protoporphyrinogen oxidase
MANILIVYATREGQTEKVARRIAGALVLQGHTAELFDADQTNQKRALVNIERFHAVVVGGPIHARGYPRSIVRFVRKHRKFLEAAPSAFFSVGLAVASRTSDGRAQTLAIVEDFVKRTGWRPSRVELIAGALPYSKYNPLIRFIMRRIAAKEGGDTDVSRDYEYTDWVGVDRFAREFVENAAGADPIGGTPASTSIRV